MYLGIDVGGTNIKGVLIDDNKKVLEKKKIATKKESKKVLIDQLLDFISSFLSEKNKGIGIGFPGIIDFDNQDLLQLPNISVLDNTKIGEIIKDNLGLDVVVENDTNCLTLGEAVLGAGKGNEIVAAITLGTGVGGGIVLSGKIYHGADGSAGEFGHIVVEDGGKACSCGNKGCLEPYINNAGIKQAFKEVFGRDIDSLGELDRMAIKNDEKAIEVYNKVGKYLGIGLGNIVNIFNPSIIVVSGGIMKAGDLILNPARSKMKECIFGLKAKNTKVVKGGLDLYGGAIGAALLHFDN
ncbi:MAG: ROK family protein [Candidatus Portnoybacteria bacterium]|nr:ROK family protein [Candidatus Portnoybacteria bacterium]